MFTAGILVCMHRPQDGIALDLFRYRDDNGWKTVLWVGLSVLNCLHNRPVSISSLMLLH